MVRFTWLHLIVIVAFIFDRLPATASGTSSQQASTSRLLCTVATSPCPRALTAARFLIGSNAGLNVTSASWGAGTLCPKPSGGGSAITNAAIHTEFTEGLVFDAFFNETGALVMSTGNATEATCNPDTSLNAFVASPTSDTSDPDLEALLTATKSWPPDTSRLTDTISLTIDLAVTASGRLGLSYALATEDFYSAFAVFVNGVNRARLPPCLDVITTYAWRAGDDKRYKTDNVAGTKPTVFSEFSPLLKTEGVPVQAGDTVQLKIVIADLPGWMYRGDSVVLLQGGSLSVDDGGYIPAATPSSPGLCYCASKPPTGVLVKDNRCGFEDRPNANGWPAGTICYATCIQGYSPRMLEDFTTARRTCVMDFANGTDPITGLQGQNIPVGTYWTNANDSAVCQLTACAGPPPGPKPPNAKFQCSTTPLGQACQAVCDKGFFGGSQRRVCLPDGTWGPLEGDACRQCQQNKKDMPKLQAPAAARSFPAGSTAVNARFTLTAPRGTTALQATLDGLTACTTRPAKVTGATQAAAITVTCRQARAISSGQHTIALTATTSSNGCSSAPVTARAIVDVASPRLPKPAVDDAAP